MSEITLHLDDALADKLQAYAVSHKTSIEEMANNYLSNLVSNEPCKYSDVELAQIAEINARIDACESGDMQTISYDELKEDMQTFVKDFKVENARDAL